MTVTLIGLLAALCSTASWIPQAAHTIRTRSTDDFSWTYLALFGTGATCWSAYGLLSHDAAVAAANLVTLAIFLIIVATKALDPRRPTQCQPDSSR